MRIDNQREQVYEWLQRTDPSPLHNQAYQQYEPSTGDWILKSLYWRDWLDARLTSLWIHGIPGAGKTVLLSSLIERIEEYCDTDNNTKRASAYYYCYFGHHQDESTPLLL